MLKALPLKNPKTESTFTRTCCNDLERTLFVCGTTAWLFGPACAGLGDPLGQMRQGPNLIRGEAVGHGQKAILEACQVLEACQNDRERTSDRKPPIASTRLVLHRELGRTLPSTIAARSVLNRIALSGNRFEARFLNGSLDSAVSEYARPRSVNRMEQAVLEGYVTSDGSILM